jgi:hypothetical protein
MFIRMGNFYYPIVGCFWKDIVDLKSGLFDDRRSESQMTSLWQNAKLQFSHYILSLDWNIPSLWPMGCWFVKIFVFLFSFFRGKFPFLSHTIHTRTAHCPLCSGSACILTLGRRKGEERRKGTDGGRIWGTFFSLSRIFSYFHSILFE